MYSIHLLYWKKSIGIMNYIISMKSSGKGFYKYILLNELYGESKYTSFCERMVKVPQNGKSATE